MEILDATAAHLPALQRIYADVVANSPATFDLEAPDLDAWSETPEACDAQRGRLLVVAVGEGDEVLGFARSGPFRPRAAYDITCETSIYMAPPARGQGISAALYSALLERLEASPLRVAIAAIAEPNPASIALHETLGFERVGTLKGVGLKFDQAWDVTLYERSLL
jgi:phosphinothricin acetyltransferase